MTELAAALGRRRAMESGEVWADVIPFDALPGMKVFLGSGRDASNLEQLKAHGVGRVLNVADDVPSFHADAGIAYRRLEVADLGAEALRHEGGIRRVFGPARDFLADAGAASASAAPNVLVHCANGSNRLATVVLALLMLQGCDLRSAWHTVKSRRPGAMPLRDNQQALVEFEVELRGASSMKEEDFGAVG